ncbi:MAG: hypothetical protein K2X38_07865 [Gemmataceae bacterium]|nr:hypothetical protein [Gemmataceae bacterium]
MTTKTLGRPIAVIDLETTGLFPWRHDRVVEIAAVIIDSEGKIVREFVSLINPERDIGPTSVHGLTSEDLLDAPHFEEIAPLLLETLEDTVAIASHNVRFDRQFLDYEFARFDCGLPDYASFCTMQLAGGGKLSDCCRDFGVAANADFHHALNDARAAANLLVALLADDPSAARQLQQSTAVRWPSIPKRGKQPVTRDEARQRQSTPPNFLQRLLERTDRTSIIGASDGAIMAYGALLDRVLEDRRVDDSEADSLVEMAEKWGLSRKQIEQTHRDYLNQLAIAAVADGIVTDSERRDLNLVARLLGQSNVELDKVLAEAANRLAETGPSSVRSNVEETKFSGKRVCFTGELQCCLNGQPISREEAERLARAAGLELASSVTKKLDILVLADPHSQSGKAKKAREYGVRIMHEPVFWRTIGVATT